MFLKNLMATTESPPPSPPWGLWLKVACVVLPCRRLLRAWADDSIIRLKVRADDGTCWHFQGWSTWNQPEHSDKWQRENMSGGAEDACTVTEHVHDGSICAADGDSCTAAASGENGEAPLLESGTPTWSSITDVPLMLMAKRSHPEYECEVCCS